VWSCAMKPQVRTFTDMSQIHNKIVIGQPLASMSG
jgi:hypothetical protein